MADTRKVVRRVVCTAGLAAAVAIAPVLVAPTALAQPVNCNSPGGGNQQNVTCAPDVPGVSAPVVLAPPASAPNIEGSSNPEQLEQGEHSGSHH